MREFFIRLRKYRGSIRKFLVALVSAATVLGASCAPDGVVQGWEWLSVGIAFAGAFGIYAVPNEDKPVL